MDDCIFCKIINNEIPAFKIWENSTHLAFLDINPNTQGVTLVIPKEHHSSNPTKISEQTLTETMKAARETAEILEQKLHVERVGFAIEGTGVDHLHIKLYPFHTNPEHKAEESAETVYNEYYQGYMTTKLGRQADFTELEELANKLIS